MKKMNLYDQLFFEIYSHNYKNNPYDAIAFTSVILAIIEIILVLIICAFLGILKYINKEVIIYVYLGTGLTLLIGHYLIYRKRILRIKACINYLKKIKKEKE
jgi:hypothetical protein